MIPMYRAYIVSEYKKYGDLKYGIGHKAVRSLILLRKIHLPFPDHCYMLVPSNSLANVEKRFKKP